MYIPAKFKVEDTGKLAEFMQQNSFATVITQTAAGPFASHLPILLGPGGVSSNKLVGHMARANPQWKHFSDGREVLVVFHGPHAYISPRWYQTGPQVPTWNYATVHAYGKPQLLTDEVQLAELLEQTVRFYEGDGPEAWRGDLPAEFMGQMLKAIVGFEISITRLEGKFKLGQNREAVDIAGAYAALSTSANPGDQALAALMKAEKVVG